MICLFHDSVFSIRNVYGSISYEIDFGKPVWITTARLSPDKRKVAIVGSDNFLAEKGGITFKTPTQLWIVELSSLQKTVVASKVSDDVLWGNDGMTVVYSTGKEIASYDISRGEATPYFRFSRTLQGTNALSLSPDGKKVSYLYWKGDSRYIGIYDFDTGIGRTLSKTCFAYSWKDNKTIVHDSQRSGIISLDLDHITSRQYIKNMAFLKLQLETLQSNPAWLEYLSSKADDIYQSVRLPKIHGDRVFFIGQVSLLKEKPIIGLFSVKRDKTDLQIHYQCFQCWVERYEFIDEGQILALHIRKYKGPWKEEHDWIYIGNGSELIPNGYIPITSDQSPVFGAYSYFSNNQNLR